MPFILLYCISKVLVTDRNTFIFRRFWMPYLKSGDIGICKSPMGTFDLLVSDVNYLKAVGCHSAVPGTPVMRGVPYSSAMNWLWGGNKADLT